MCLLALMLTNGAACGAGWALQILKRINSVIQQRIAQGEKLPPPPRTAIAGPEYFGLNDPVVVEAIEGLDTDEVCSTYWEGKAAREAKAAGHAPPPRPAAAATASRVPRGAGGGSGGGAGAPGSRKRGRGRGGRASEEEEDEADDGYRGTK